MNASKNFLDVDESILEKNLLIRSDEEQQFEQFVSDILNPDAGKLVKPAPGICIKTFKSDNQSKVFINLCHHADIPAPEDITQEELVEILSSQDPERYCVPLSIGTEHVELDKGKQTVNVYDVAVNTEFFNKCRNDEVFQTFIVSATIEAIAEKFDFELSSNVPILLKNRKCFGTLQQHRIQQRSPRPSALKKKPLIQELSLNRSLPSLDKHVTPEFKIYVQPEDNPKKLIADIWLPDVISLEEIDLKCGVDCIFLTTKKQTKYDLDICLPYDINNQNVDVTFNTLTKFLTVMSAITAR